MLGPKYQVSKGVPARLPPMGTFDDGLPDIIMMLFDHAISLRIVGGDADMADTISVCEDVCAWTKAGPLSVTISERGPHQQRRSSKMKEESVVEFSECNMRHSG